MRVIPGFDIIFASVRPCSLVMQLLRLHWRRAANTAGGVLVPVLRLLGRFLAVGMPVLLSFLLTIQWDVGKWLGFMFNVQCSILTSFVLCIQYSVLLCIQQNMSKIHPNYTMQTKTPCWAEVKKIKQSGDDIGEEKAKIDQVPALGDLNVMVGSN